jgi:hypothetical protein
LGEPPKPARGPRALPIPISEFGFNHGLPRRSGVKAETSNSVYHRFFRDGRNTSSKKPTPIMKNADGSGMSA